MLNVTRLHENGGREATLLQNDRIRVLIDDKGGMTPEFSIKTENGYLNTHWVPQFRANSGEPYQPEKHAAFWKSELLYDISGNFPCAPSFGAEHRDGQVWHPTHGWAASRVWQAQYVGVDKENQVVYAIYDMPSPDPNLPLFLKKVDLLIENQPVHYSAIRFENRGEENIQANVGFHNTLGSPFLQAGDIISLCAGRFATPPLGGEFDDTGRLALGAEFTDLTHAPLRNGKWVDISLVPGMIGYTDFITGAVPDDAEIGWSSVVNPMLNLAYICFFKGPNQVAANEIALSFNDLWLQFGGRNFTPWSSYNGAPDSTYCLGTENTVGAYATGLGNAKKLGRVLDAPTTFDIPPHASKVLYYGTMILTYQHDLLSGGIKNIRPVENGLVIDGQRDSMKAGVDVEFSTIKAIEG